MTKPAGRPSATCASARGGRCRGATKSGKPCPNRGEGKACLCLLHDPARAEERRKLLSRRGRAGRRKQTDRRREAAVRVALGSAEAIRATLERALGAVMASKASPVEKAHVAVRVCAVAHQVLAGADLEQRFRELQELVCDRIPGAREKLCLPIPMENLQ